jgi:hypothetical protein
MAFPSLSNMNQDPFFTTAFKQGSVPSNEFALYLNSTGSELFLGGTNSKLYSGTIEYHTISSSSGFWQIGGAKAVVNGATSNSGFETIIDSGTSIGCLLIVLLNDYPRYGDHVWTSLGREDLLLQSSRFTAIRLDKRLLLFPL